MAPHRSAPKGRAYAVPVPSAPGVLGKLDGRYCFANPIFAALRRWQASQTSRRAASVDCELPAKRGGT